MTAVELRSLETPSATQLAGLCATFEDLTTVLGCCERLVADLDGVVRAPDEVTLEALWTLALLSYRRCFAPGALTEADLDTSEDGTNVVAWHETFLKLRDHYAGRAVNPRERFSVGVTQDDAGAASGVGIASEREPPVDQITVRQLGAVAFALRTTVDGRITAGQAALLEELRGTDRSELDDLPLVEVAAPDVADRAGGAGGPGAPDRDPGSNGASVSDGAHGSDVPPPPGG